jgi:hypothetical protein
MRFITLIPLLGVCILLIISAIQHYKNYVARKKCLAHEIAVEKLLDWYYGVHFLLTPKTADIVVENKVDNTVYGEITYQGMQILANKLKLTPRDVFYDLGCGMGKLVLYMYLAKPIKKSVGIEMIGKRYTIADYALASLVSQGFLDPKRELKLIHNNIRNENFSDATAIFMSSLCFPPGLIEELDQKFSKFKKGLRVATLKPLPESTRLTLVDISYLPMTWTATSRIHYYELT